tara:strand:+ start:264 stop:677 length:414 start_codon:yes stop_codon:yes gene_type:complete
MDFKKIIAVIFFILNYMSHSQENIKIEYSDKSIEKLIKISTQLNTEINISTYSIQLQANESPELIEKTKKKYSLLFPNEIITEIFEPPYFKIITGTYLDKKKAEKKLKIIQENFKSAFVLKREITIDEFKKNQLLMK